MIPKSMFVFDEKYRTKLAVLSQAETADYQREFGAGICQKPDSSLSLAKACKGTRRCNIGLCEKGSIPIGSFHTHPSTAPLPSYNDFISMFSNQTTDPQLDCIGGYITPRQRKVVCLTSCPPFQGLLENHPYWKKTHFGVSYYTGKERDIELYMSSDQRQAALREGLTVLEKDVRFEVSVFNCDS